MSRFHQVGVTLLEIMLVLAVAAMVIVMSIRYYQAANASQQSSAFLAQLNAVNAAGEQLYAGGDVSQVTLANVTALMGGASKMTTPGGGCITTVTPSGTSFSATATSIPGAVCSAVKAQAAANTRVAVSTTCAATAGSFTWTYDFSK